jgi:hypothetical protein
MAFLAALQAGRNAGATSLSQLTASRDFAKFLNVNNMTFTHEAGLAWLMLEATNTAMGPNAHVPRVPNDVAALCCALRPAAPAAGSAATATTYFAANGPDTQVLAEGVTPAAFRALLSDSGAAIYWLLDLTACHQIKPLKAMNISNFFRMSSRINITGREILKVLEYASSAIEKITQNNALMALLNNNTFMTYHTSFSSTATLVQEMLSSSPGVTNVMFSAATRTAVANSAAHLHDQALNASISQQAILATYAYLVAFSKLPENWFQGEKAKSSLPATRYAAYVAIFRRLRALSADIAAIEGAADVEALIAAIGPDLQGA